MRVFPCILALWLATPFVAWASDVEIRADWLDAEGLGHDGPTTMRAHGNVRVKNGTLTLYAPELEWERASEKAHLTGGVVGHDGIAFIEARSIEADTRTESLQLDGGQVLFKKGVDEAELERLVRTDAEAARSCGINAMTLRALEVDKTDAGLEGRSVWLTTCECPDGCRPMLSVTAASVEVVPGDRATLKWPVFWLFDLVPVFPPLPQLTLPLVNRRTGLLFPVFSMSGPGGLTFEVPYFITLGESADVTVSGVWHKGGVDTETGALVDRSVRGFGANAEFRWRPAEDAAGHLFLNWVRDTVPEPLDATDGTIRGHRGSFALRHAQGLLGGRLSLEGELASDSSVLRDQSLAMVAERPYLRSQVTWSRAEALVGGALSSTAFQDMRRNRSPWAEGDGVMAPIAQGIMQIHRAFGPVFADATLTAAEEQALPGFDVFVPDSQANELPPRYSRSVLSLRLAQSLPIAAGDAGLVAFEAGERLDVIAPHDRETTVRGGAYGGLWARTRLVGQFGRLTHEITPSLRLRGFLVGGAPYASYLYGPRADAPQSPVEAALPSSNALQSVAGFSTSLALSGRVLVAASLEHHATIWPVDIGQLVGTLAVPIGPTRLSARTALRLLDNSIAQASAAWSGGASFGSVSLGAQYLAGVTNDRISQGLDLLFTPPVGIEPGSPQRLVTVDGGARLNLPFIKALSLAGNINLSRLLDAVEVEWRPSASASLVYGVGGCGSISIGAAWSDDYIPALTFGFELGDITQALQTIAK